jgi:hypothetical protein
MECSLHLTLGFDLARLLFAPVENFLAFRAGGNRCCYGCCPKWVTVGGHWSFLYLYRVAGGESSRVLCLLLRGDLGRWLHGIGIKKDGIHSSISVILAPVTM